MVKPFRFGAVVEHVNSPGEWVNKAKHVEELGYDAFLVPHHLSLSPVVPLTIAAIATSHIKVGSFVFNIDFIQNPVFWAGEAASLDQFSRGRLELGLGAGYVHSEYEQAGIPFDEAGVRVSRFEEALHIIKRLLETEEPVKYAGKHYTVDYQSARTPSFQKPRPPIYIGGGGRRVLSIAAREADIVGVVPRSLAQGLEGSSVTAEATAQKVEWVRRAAEERFSQLEISTMVFHVMITPANPVQVAQQVINYLSRHLFAPNQTVTPEEILNSPHFLIGSLDQICEGIIQRRERFGISYITVLEKDLDTFAPVVARLTGK